MKFKFILISALMLFGVKAAAQTAGGRITGIVVDEVEDSPLTGATILIQELKRGEVADFDGKFTFQDLPEATYTVSVDYMGYLPWEKKIRVERGKTVNLTIPMKAEPLSLEQATVTAKSEARMVREQAMPVSVISMKQLQGTVSDIQGIPYSDGHSVSIEYHDGQVYFSAFGVDKAGVFSYDPKTEAVQQVISLSGNLAYIHFFD